MPQKIAWVMTQSNYKHPHWWFCKYHVDSRLKSVIHFCVFSICVLLMCKNRNPIKSQHRWMASLRFYNLWFFSHVPYCITHMEKMHKRQPGFSWKQLRTTYSKQQWLEILTKYTLNYDINILSCTIQSTSLAIIKSVQQYNIVLMPINIICIIVPLLQIHHLFLIHNNIELIFLWDTSYCSRKY